jgi:hypothetical protein
MTEVDTDLGTGLNRILFVPGYWDMGSSIMMERLKAAERLWWQSDGQYDWIIVSGGVTRRRQLVSEADFMKEWLVEHAGVAPGKIIPECCSCDSFESVRNVVEGCLRDPMYAVGNVGVTIVSQREHANRLRVTFEAYGVCAGIVPVPGYSVMRRIFEWGCLYYTLYDPKGESRFSRWKAVRTRNALQGF